MNACTFFSQIPINLIVPKLEIHRSPNSQTTNFRPCLGFSFDFEKVSYSNKCVWCSYFLDSVKNKSCMYNSVSLWIIYVPVWTNHILVHEETHFLLWIINILVRIPDHTFRNSCACMTNSFACMKNSIDK